MHKIIFNVQFILQIYSIYVFLYNKKDILNSLLFMIFLYHYIQNAQKILS